MVNSCVSCGFRLGKECGRSSHRIPIKNGIPATEWREFLGKDEGWLPNSEARVCAKHFHDSCFRMSSSKAILTSNAVPTITLSRVETTTPFKLLNGKVRILEIRDENFDEPIQNLTLSDFQNTEQLIRIQKLEQEKLRVTRELEVLSKKFNAMLTLNEVMKRQIALSNVELSSEKGKNRKLSAVVLSLNSKLVRIKDANEKLSASNQKLSQESVRYQAEHLKAYNLDDLQKKGGAIMAALVKRTISAENSHYTKEIMKFSTTMIAYSKKSYNHLRTTFQNILPSTRTIQKLLATIEIKPGFLTPCLKKMHEMHTASEAPLYCNMTLDEMHIRNQILMNTDGEIVGFLDYGLLKYPVVPDKMATNALFVMAVGVNGGWKLPIGYFLTCGLPSDLFCEVVTESLIKIHETGIRNIGVTFDGLPANFSAMERLGASMKDPLNLEPWILHPVHGGKVYIIPDPPHMLKLMRNLWTNKTVGGILYDEEDNELNWNLIKRLHEIQSNEGVRAANGLTPNHINFSNQKMKVSLAAKIFSQSVSKALQFCRDIGMEEFKFGLLLSRFLDTMDRGFDLLNIRHAKAQCRKAPLTNQNRGIWTKTIADMKQCLFGLKVKDQETGELVPLLNTNLSTGPLGFLISLTSVESIMSELVCCENPALKYLLTYKFCQDHIEILFSTLRACGEFNNNPNTIQLFGAIKKVLSGSISPSLKGNCLPLDDTSLPEIRKIRTAFIQQSDFSQGTDESNVNDEHLPVEHWDYSSLTEFTQCVTAYIAGNVVKKLQKKIKCEECLHHMLDDCDVCVCKDMALVEIKQNGGLVMASKDVRMICKVTESIVRHVTSAGPSNLNMKKVQSMAFQQCLPLEPFQCLHYNTRFTVDPFSSDNHNITLIKLIIQEYAKIRIHHFTKEWTRNQKRTTIRQRNTKLTLFQGM